MKTLVVGGLGYVGGRLCQSLLVDPRYDITISTKRQTYPTWTKSVNISYLNLEDVDSIRQCIQRVKPEIIIHLGALQQGQCLDDEAMALKINQEGTDCLASIAHETGVKHLMYVSTFQVYGHFTGHISEEVSVDPQTIYSRSKWLGEQAVLKYQSNDLNTVILRLANAYGKPSDCEVAENVWTLAFNSFCLNATKGKELVVKANPQRDFISMPDVIQAITLLLEKRESDWEGQIYNVGGNQTLSILDVAKFVAAEYATLFDTEVPCIRKPLNVDESTMKNFEYSIDRIKRLGFLPQGDMKQQVRETIGMCYAMENDI